MQSPTHFVVGALICRAVPYRPLGLVLALGSHFALDALPHFEDPSLVPDALVRPLERAWPWVLVAVQLLTVAALLWVWRVYGPRRGDRDGCRTDVTRGPWYAAYLIAGGLLAAAPDALTQFIGPSSFASWLNMEVHDPWMRVCDHVLRHYPTSRPLVGAVCLATEALVAALAVRRLWSGARGPRRARGPDQAG